MLFLFLILTSTFTISRAMLFEILDHHTPDEQIAMMNAMDKTDLKDHLNIINDHGDTPLLHVCKKVYPHKEDQTLLAQMLIENGADINAKTVDGNTAAHLAVWKSNASLLKLLYDKNPFLLDIKNKSDASAYNLAARLEKDEIFHTISKSGTFDKN